MADLSRRRELLALALILLLALGLRLYRLDAQSLWNDEGTSVALAGRDLATIARNASADIHPPLYYYLLHAWVRLAGNGEFAVRLLSALAGVGVVAALYALGRRLLSPAAGLLGALFTALSPFQVYYSQEARMYVLCALFSMLSALATVGLLDALDAPAEGRRMAGRALFWVVAAALAVYTHYFAFAVILAEDLVALGWLLGLARRDGGRVPWKPAAVWASAQVAVLLAYLPWLAISWRSLRQWPAVSEPLVLGAYLTDVARVWGLGLTAPERMLTRGAGLALALPALVAPAAAWPRRNLSRRPTHRQDDWGGAWMAAALCGVPVLVMFALSLQRPMYKPKLLLPATPAYYLLQAQGVLVLGRAARRALGGRALAGVLAAALAATPVLAASGYSLRNLYADPRYARDDYRGIVAYIQEHARPEDALLINAPSQIETVDYYYRGDLPQYPLPEDRPLNEETTRAALQEIVARHRTLYGIFWATDESDPIRFIETWLDEHCFKAADRWFGNLRLVVYAVPLESAGGEAAETVDCLFGEAIRLRGYSLLTPRSRPGDILQLALHWEALRPVRTRYKVFVHLLDAEGRIVSQRDAEPGGGARLTTTWTPGEPVVDRYGLLVPADAPPGEYALRVGLYGLEDGARLPLTRDGAPAGDALDLPGAVVAAD